MLEFGPGSGAEPEPEPEPDPGAEPEPDPEPDPEQESEAEPEPGPEAEPGPEPEPEPECADSPRQPRNPAPWRAPRGYTPDSERVGSLRQSFDAAAAARRRKAALERKRQEWQRILARKEAKLSERKAASAMAKLQRSAEETARRATEVGWARHVASAAANYASAEELAREMQQRVEQRRELVQPPPGPGGLAGTGAWKAKLGSADPELVALERRCFQAQLEQENCRLRLETLQYHRETQSRTPRLADNTVRLITTVSENKPEEVAAAAGSRRIRMRHKGGMLEASRPWKARQPQWLECGRPPSPLGVISPRPPPTPRPAPQPPEHDSPPCTAEREAPTPTHEPDSEPDRPSTCPAAPVSLSLDGSRAATARPALGAPRGLHEESSGVRPASSEPGSPRWAAGVSLDAQGLPSYRSPRHSPTRHCAGQRYAPPQGLAKGIALALSRIVAACAGCLPAPPATGRGSSSGRQRHSRHRPRPCPRVSSPHDGLASTQGSARRRSGYTERSRRRLRGDGMRSDAPRQPRPQADRRQCCFAICTTGCLCLCSTTRYL